MMTTPFLYKISKPCSKIMKTKLKVVCIVYHIFKKGYKNVECLNLRGKPTNALNQVLIGFPVPGD